MNENFHILLIHLFSVASVPPTNLLWNVPHYTTANKKEKTYLQKFISILETKQNVLKKWMLIAGF